MCCDNMNEGGEAAAECVDCGVEIDSAGEALDQCAHSSSECDTCGWAPCDMSC
jgi:hypothetical protein